MADPLEIPAPLARRPPRQVSCGVVVTDGRHVLIGHATRTVRWDIPKGLAEPGELPEATARRELEEETGLVVTAPSHLEALGNFRYRPGKDLALYLWLVKAMPDPITLVCRSTFLVSGRPVPEFDRYAIPPWAEALPLLAASMRAVLEPLARTRCWL